MVQVFFLKNVFKFDLKRKLFNYEEYIEQSSS